MKTLFMGMLLLLHGSLLYPQCVIEKDEDCFLDNETLKRIQIDCASQSEGQSGESITWDFSGRTPLNKKYISNYFQTGKMSMAKHEHQTFYNYKLNSDTLCLYGYKNATTEVSYLIPEIVLVYPFGFQNTISHYFYGIGTYSDRINWEVFGEKNIQADAHGTLILPSGDTISNVIRVHSNKIMSQRIFPEGLLNKDSISIPPMDTIRDRLNANSSELKTEVFEWYMNGFCKPIFEMVKNTVYKSGKPYQYFRTAFYYPIEDLKTNSTMRESIKPKINTNNNVDPDIKNKDLFDFDSRLDKWTKNITIEYGLMETANVDVMLFDTLGRLLFQDSFTQQSPGSYNLNIDVSKYPQMEFIVRLSVNKSIYNKKIFSK